LEGGEQDQTSITGSACAADRRPEPAQFPRSGHLLHQDRRSDQANLLIRHHHCPDGRPATICRVVETDEEERGDCRRSQKA
jgi:hypothetical protein